MKNVFGKLVSTIKYTLWGLVAGMVVNIMVLNLAILYILVVPDNIPKPFYLSYSPYGAGPKVSNNISTETHSESSLLIPSVAQAAEKPAKSQKKTHEEVHNSGGLMISTGSKIINLAEPGGRKYIRICVVLEFEPPDPAYYQMIGEERQAFVSAFEEEINSKLPLIDDSIIMLISSKRFEEVYTAEGKETLRNEILNAINSRLEDYRVISVYLTEFVVQ